MLRFLGLIHLLENRRLACAFAVLVVRRCIVRSRLCVDAPGLSMDLMPSLLRILSCLEPMPCQLQDHREAERAFTISDCRKQHTIDHSPAAGYLLPF